MKHNSLLAILIGAACLAVATTESRAMSTLVTIEMESMWPGTSTPGNVLTYRITPIVREGQGLLEVYLSCGGMPEGVLVEFSPPMLRFTGRVPDTQSSIMTVTCPYPMPIDQIPFTVTATAQRESVTITNGVSGGSGKPLPTAPTMEIYRPAGLQPMLRGLGGSGQTYQIESTIDLGNPDWTVIGSTTADGNGRFIFPLGDMTEPMRFFRAVGLAGTEVP